MSNLELLGNVRPDNKTDWHIFSQENQPRGTNQISKDKKWKSRCAQREYNGLDRLSGNGVYCKSGSEENDKTARKLICYLSDDDVQSMEQLIREGIDVNEKISVASMSRVLQNTDGHQDDFDHDIDDKTNSDPFDSTFMDEGEDMKEITLLQFCISNKKLNTLSFLSSLDQVSEEEIRTHLKECDADCRRHIMLGLQKRLEKKHRDATVHLGRLHKSDSLMFLVSSESLMEGRTERIAGVQVELVNPFTAFENKKADIDKKEKRLEDQWVILLQNARRAHEDKLYESHTNINVISISSINTRNTNAGEEPPFEPCIVIYCSNVGFIPDGEKPFPRYIEYNGVQIPIDVRDDNSFPVMKVGNYKQSGQQRVRMGYRIHRSGKNKQGSVGPFVQRHPLQVEFLTSAHVLFDIGKIIGQLPLHENRSENDVLHEKPSANGSHTFSSSENVCGVLQKGFFRPDRGVDVAVVQVTEPCTPLEGKFRELEDEQCQNIGLEAPFVFNSGKIVSKDDIRNFIARSIKESDNPIIIGNSDIPRISLGRLHQDGVLVSTRLEFNGVRHVMKDVYRVISYMNYFIERGDSGSGVFVKRGSELQCIGIALSQGKEGRTAFVTPIDSVLEVLGQDVKLKAFYTSRHTLPSTNKKSKAKRNQSV